LNEIIENILFIIVGMALLIPLLLKFIELPEILMILLVFVGLAAVLNGAFNIIYIVYHRFKKSKSVY
jgi:uncharacterized membrane protein HdeD (DUF308 family)